MSGRLPDYLAFGLRVVFCGTAAGKRPPRAVTITRALGISSERTSTERKSPQNRSSRRRTIACLSLALD
jgi:hypothetical protein